MARATRSSVRAGTARLEDKQQPPTRSTRSARTRSTSVTTTSSNDDAENRKKHLSFLPFAQAFGPTFARIFFPPLRGLCLVNALASKSTTAQVLTRPQLEAAVDILIERDQQSTRRVQEQAATIQNLEQRQVEAASRIAHLTKQANDTSDRYAFSHTPRAEKRKARDIRRHFAIEVPTQQKLLQDAVNASNHAQQAEAEQRNITKTVSPDTSRIAATAQNDNNDVNTPRQSSHSPIHQQPHNTESGSPQSYFSSIFDTVRKVFTLSPTKRLQQTNPQQTLTPIHEESPSAGRTKNTNQSETDGDLSQIVRKRKAAQVPPESSANKKTKVDAAHNNFAVPSESNSDSETTQQNPLFLTQSNNQPRNPAVSPTQSQQTASATAPTTPRRRDSTTKTQHAEPETVVRRRRTPGRSTKRPARSDNTASENTEPAQETEKPDEEMPVDTPAVPPSRRRTARSARDQRDVSSKSAGPASELPAFTPLQTRVSRPHYFEIKNYDQYKTIGEADAAVDAMLALENAEDLGLPPPTQTVTPAERSLPRITSAHFKPHTLKAKTVATKDSPASTRAVATDLRDLRAKSKDAERRRLLERARQLKEEQLKAEEELAKLELAEQEAEAGHEVGKKRKRINIDEISTIPSRRPGQSGGTFALLDEFFDIDDSEVEVDASQADLLVSRPTKMARTEANIFDAASPAKSPAPGETPQSTIPTPALSSSAVQDASLAPATPNHMSQALQRKRSEVEKYKPKQSSTLREMQRSSPGSSMMDTSMSQPPVVPASFTASKPAVPPPTFTVPQPQPTAPVPPVTAPIPTLAPAAPITQQSTVTKDSPFNPPFWFSDDVSQEMIDLLNTPSPFDAEFDAIQVEMPDDGEDHSVMTPEEEGHLRAFEAWLESEECKVSMYASA